MRRGLRLGEERDELDEDDDEVAEGDDVTQDVDVGRVVLLEQRVAPRDVVEAGEGQRAAAAGQNQHDEAEELKSNMM